MKELNNLDVAASKLTYEVADNSKYVLLGFHVVNLVTLNYTLEQLIFNNLFVAGGILVGSLLKRKVIAEATQHGFDVRSRWKLSGN